MSDEKMDKRLIIKYIQYLTNYSNQLMEKQDLNKVDLETIQRECNLFINKIESNDDVDKIFKEDFRSIIINAKGNQHETKTDKFTKNSILIFQIIPWLFARSGFNKDNLRESIKEFRDRLSNILFKIETYEFGS